MEYRRIGQSGLTVSEIGLGCASATFAGTADEQTSINIITHALELGINYVDTAETYAEGRSETLIGRALKGKRSEVIIGTKFGKDRSLDPSEQRASCSRLMKSVEGSLKRLDTDYIDLYIMHEPDPNTPIEETLRALDDLVRTGKVRYIGCSNFAAWQLCNALWTSRVHNVESFIIATAHYNLIDRRIERELIPCCQAFGIAVGPLWALAGGFLTGKYHRGKKMPENTRFTRVASFINPEFHDPGRYDGIVTDANFDKLAKLEAFAKERGHSVTELAIAWLLSRSYMGMVLVGVTSAEQLTQNVAGLGWKLTAEDITQLDKMLSSIA